MIAEWKGLEYTCEILRVMHRNEGKHDSKKIAEMIVTEARIPAQLSYVQKILPRMVKAGLLKSTGEGYCLSRPIDDIMVSDVLEICSMPEPVGPLHKLCNEIKSAVSMTSIDEFYEF